MLVYIKKKKRHTWALSRRRPCPVAINVFCIKKKDMLVYIKKEEKKDTPMAQTMRVWRRLGSFSSLSPSCHVLRRLYSVL
jgi:hypothetical protein